MRFDLFSSQRLYEALREARYPDLPSERTVRRWIKDNAPPASAVEAVARLLQLPDATKEPPPEWARELADQTARRVIEALAPDDLRRALAIVRARLEAIPPPGDEAPHGIDGERGGGTADPKARSDESRRDRAS